MEPKKTGDEVFREYTEALAEINKQAHEARERARATLHKQLKTLQSANHEALKAIRAIQQKTKGGK